LRRLRVPLQIGVDPCCFGNSAACQNSLLLEFSAVAAA
jgi:hypothetical protein